MTTAGIVWLQSIVPLGRRTQIIPICGIGAGFDEIGEAAPNGGYLCASTRGRGHVR